MYIRCRFQNEPIRVPFSKSTVVKTCRQKFFAVFKMCQQREKAIAVCKCWPITTKLEILCSALDTCNCSGHSSINQEPKLTSISNLFYLQAAPVYNRTQKEVRYTINKDNTPFILGGYLTLNCAGVCAPRNYFFTLGENYTQKRKKASENNEITLFTASLRANTTGLPKSN